jgi:formylmethanofuran dehydrogenase subunit E
VSTAEQFDVEDLGYGPIVATCAHCGDDILRDETHWELPDGEMWCDPCLSERDDIEWPLLTA